MSKKKIATMAISGILATSLILGGATYALFTSSATNEDNMAEAGTLTLSTHRNDVPIEGPMFYVNDNAAGRMGTGIWAPLDSHSRAMFIRNTGSLDGKISKLFAQAESNPIDAQKFAEQALVTIGVFESGGVAVDATVARQVNEAFDAWFKALMAGPGWAQAIAQGQQAIEAFIRESALDFVYSTDSSGNSIFVSDVFVGTLDNLLNSSGVDPFQNIILPSGNTMHLGYTVTLLDDQMPGATFENNDIMGLTTQFRFIVDFEQADNN